jgi:hypothetical protein
MTKRFSNEVDMEDLLASKYAKKTDYMNKYAWNLLTSFATSKNIEPDYTCKESIDSLLCDYFRTVKKEDGSLFTLSSFITVRYAIARNLKDKYGMDIVKDHSFVKSNDVFDAMKMKLKKEGKALVHHYPIIEEEDLNRIASMSIEDPIFLQYKVWFTLHLHFVLRGRENLADLLQSDIIIFSQNGVEKVMMKDTLTKNHRSDSQPSTSAVMTATEDCSCPVDLIKLYLSKLNKDLPALWQKPKSSYPLKSDSWYCKQKVGINIVTQFMKRLSSHIQLTREYTNHSVRATAITLLGRVFQDTEVASFSGHKSLASLGIYKRVSEKIKTSMSNALSSAISTTTPIDSENQHSHDQCCISYGANSTNNSILPTPVIIPQPVSNLDNEAAIDSNDEFLQILNLPEIREILDGSSSTLPSVPRIAPQINYKCNIQMHFHLSK